MALDLLDADIEQADGRPLAIEQNAGHRTAHHRHLHQMLRVAADGGAEIQHHGIAPLGRQYCSNRRAVDTRHRAQAKSRHRHQCAGVAGRDRDIRLMLLHRLDRQPHRRFLAAAAQCLARLVVHADGDVGVDNARGRFQRRIFRQFGIDQDAVAIQQEFGVGMPGQCSSRPWNDHRCADVAAHGVKRDSNLLRHGRSGNLISSGLRRARPNAGRHR